MTRDEAIKWLDNLTQDIGQMRHQDLWDYAQALAEISQMIDEMPPEMVRCKDCKYCTEQGDWCQNENVQSMCFTDGEVEHYFGDKRGHLYPDMDFFCKYGERKETE